MTPEDLNMLWDVWQVFKLIGFLICLVLVYLGCWWLMVRGRER